MKKSKKYIEKAKGIERSRLYSPKEALEWIKDEANFKVPDNKEYMNPERSPSSHGPPSPDGFRRNRHRPDMYIPLREWDFDSLFQKPPVDFRVQRVRHASPQDRLFHPA